MNEQPKQTALLALIEAAKPFIAVLERDISATDRDGVIFVPKLSGNNGAPVLTIGDFRALQAALKLAECQP
jgi:hypothetical protein